MVIVLEVWDTPVYKDLLQWKEEVLAGVNFIRLNVTEAVKRRRKKSG